MNNENKPRFILPEFQDEEEQVNSKVNREIPKEIIENKVEEPVISQYNSNIIKDEDIIRERQEVITPKIEEPVNLEPIIIDKPVVLDRPVVLDEPVILDKPVVLDEPKEVVQVNTIDYNEQRRIERELTKVEEKPIEDEYAFYAPKTSIIQPYRRKKISFVPIEDNNDYKTQTDLIGVEQIEKDPNIFVKPIIEESTTNNNEPIIKEEPKNNIQSEIDKILNIPNLDTITAPRVEEVKEIEQEVKPVYIDEVETLDFVTEDKYDFKDLDANTEVEITKEDLVVKLSREAELSQTETIIGRYGEDFTTKHYVTNPAIGRAEEIKQLCLIILTPEKSAILVGKPGIGKTSIVEGLAYALQRNNVPDALKGFTIVSVKTPSLLGTLKSGETRLQTLVDELKKLDKVILFIDEIHMLIGSTNESALDFANMFKEGLGRGSIKIIGATTTEEYERYILRDKAFVRRFQKVEIKEPEKEQTIKILMGTLPKIEKNTGAKLKYTHFMQTEIMSFIVDITSEFKRIYGIGSRYPDICITLLAQAYSQAVFDDRHDVTIMDIRNAIENSKNIYPDVIRKELVNFDIKFKDLIREEREGSI